MMKLLDVLIGMCLVYLLFSVATSALTEMWASAWKKRAKMLEESLLKMLGEAAATDSPTLATNVLNHQMISSLKRTDERFASYITPATFSSALVDTLLQSTPKDTAAVGVLDWNSEAAFKALTQKIEALPMGLPVRQALLTLTNQSQQSVETFRHLTEQWFDDQMARTSGWYKRYAQKIAFVAGLFLAASINVDTIHIASSLWTNAKLREQTTGIAAALVADKDEKISDARQQLLNSGLPIGWLDSTNAAGEDQACETQTLRQRRDCIAELSSPEQCWMWLTKLFGYLLTALSVMLGAHFWFDLLSTFINIRSGGAKPQAPKESDEPAPAASTKPTA